MEVWAWKYEEKISNQNEEKITRQCWEERQENRLGKTEKIKFLNNLGFSEEILNIWRNRGWEMKEIEDELLRRGRDIGRQIRQTNKTRQGIIVVIRI